MTALFQLRDELQTIFDELGMKVPKLLRIRHALLDGRLMHDLIWISQFFYPVSADCVHFTTAGFGFCFEIPKVLSLHVESIGIVIIREEMSPSCERAGAPVAVCVQQKDTYGFCFGWRALLFSMASDSSYSSFIPLSNIGVLFWFFALQIADTAPS